MTILNQILLFTLFIQKIQSFNISLSHRDAFLQGLEFLIEENENDSQDDEYTKVQTKPSTAQVQTKPSTSPIISKIVDFSIDKSTSPSTSNILAIENSTIPSISNVSIPLSSSNTINPTRITNFSKNSPSIRTISPAREKIIPKTKQFYNNNDTFPFEFEIMSYNGTKNLLTNTPTKQKRNYNVTLEPETMKPTYRQTDKPSYRQTDKPTTLPTLHHTSVPSTSPSSIPSIAPTAMLSTYPSIRNSTVPSVSTKPTFSPSKLPSLFPSTIPSIFPTVFPSTMPSASLNPSQFPSMEPSVVPSLIPTTFPSSIPSLDPTTFPSSVPSLLPSISLNPSSSPTSKPTKSPSKHPSTTPSFIPSITPTTFPSISPSSSPSYQLQEQLVKDVAMEFDDCAFLTNDDVRTWQRVTADHIQSYFDPSMEQLYVNTTLTLQDDEALIDKNNTLRHRSLQVKSLWILFNVYSSFRTPDTYDTSLFIGQAFANQTGQNQYIAKLQDTNNPVFSSINFVQVYINNTLQQNEDLAPSQTSDDGPNKASFFTPQAITGIAFGAICVLLLLGFVICIVWRRKNYLLYLREDRSEDSSVEGDNNFIQVHGMEDVSTLGDPMYPHHGNIDKETTVGGSTISVDYDYTGAYGGVGAANSVSTTGATGTGTKENPDHNLLDEEITDDEFHDEKQYSPTESTSEHFFVIDAPAGKLGVIIDAPNGLSPSVYSIKEGSVLANRVQVGDQLISVDGQDCTGISAGAVSKLISSKIYNETRQLVFMRKNR